MVVEMIEDYRPYLGYLIPKVKPLLDEFRAQGLPVFFSNWARRPGDGLYGGLDRAAGFAGVTTQTNTQYTYKDGGLFPVTELMPTKEELRMGHLIRSIHLNKFADVDSTGKSILADKLKALGVDTLVLTGGWTNACILATAMDAVDSKNLDVLIVSDAVGTAVSGQTAVLEAVEYAFKLHDSATILSYLQEHEYNTSYILAPDSPLDTPSMFHEMVFKYSNAKIASNPSIFNGLYVPLLGLIAGILFATVQTLRCSVAIARRRRLRSQTLHTPTAVPLFERVPCVEQV